MRNFLTLKALLPPQTVLYGDVLWGPRDVDSRPGATEKGRSFLKFICAINIVLSVTINTPRNAVKSSKLKISNNQIVAK